MAKLSACETRLVCPVTRSLCILTVSNSCSLTGQAVPYYPFLSLFSVSQLMKFAICHFFGDPHGLSMSVGLVAEKHHCFSSVFGLCKFILAGLCSDSSLKLIKASHHLPKCTCKVFFDTLPVFHKNTGTFYSLRYICNLPP